MAHMHIQIVFLTVSVLIWPTLIGSSEVTSGNMDEDACIQQFGAARCIRDKLSRTLEAWNLGPKENQNEFGDRLLNLIKYNEGFLYLFEPLDLTPYLSTTKGNLDCFKTLHGLSSMRKIRQTSTKLTPTSFEVYITFLYPKLCAKYDLGDIRINAKDEAQRQEAVNFGRYINVCAKNLRGELNMIFADDMLESPRKLGFHVNDVKFKLDFAGNTRKASKKVRPVWKELKKKLGPLGKAVSELLNNQSKSIITSMDIVYRRAGNCSMGICSTVEGITDFELIDRIKITLLRTLKSEPSIDPKYLHPSTAVKYGEYKIFLKTLEGFSDVEIMGYDKIEETEQRWYRLAVILRYPLVCLSGFFRNSSDPDSEHEFSMCDKNFLTYLNIYYQYGVFSLGMFQNMSFTVPMFRPFWNISRIPPPIQQYFYDGMFRNDCDLAYSIYKDLMIAVQSALKEMNHCNSEECLQQPGAREPFLTRYFDVPPFELLDAFKNTFRIRNFGGRRPR